MRALRQRLTKRLEGARILEPVFVETVHERSRKTGRIQRGEKSCGFVGAWKRPCAEQLRWERCAENTKRHLFEKRTRRRRGFTEQDTRGAAACFEQRSERESSRIFFGVVCAETERATM